MMKCKKCNSEIRFGTEQVGVDKQGIPIFHRMGYCDYCKTKFDVDITQYKHVNKKQNKTNKELSSAIGAVIIIFLLCGCFGSCVSCLNGINKNDNTSEYVENDSISEEEQLPDYSNIMVEEKYKQNFIDACIACGIDAEKVNSFSKIENWSNGERYTFYYNDVMHTVYFLDSGEVNSINYGANNDIKLYEYGYEPLNINDFEIDGGTYASLQIAAENVVKTDLGPKFSKRLIKCCQRLAKIHGYTVIYFLYDVRMDTDKFRTQLSDFMKDKDVVIACEGGNLLDVSEKTKNLAELIGVSLKKEDLEKETELANDSNVPCLKLLIQDNLAD